MPPAAAAIAPAAIGAGASLFGSITGKNAAKKQQQFAERQYNDLKPLIDTQIAGSKYGVEEGKNLLGMSKPYIKGAASGIQDLQNYWRPLMSGDRSAMDQYLSKERDYLNRGYRSASENIAKFTGRGGGRISGLLGADMDRQGKLSTMIGDARRQGAGELKDLAGMLGQLGTGVGSLGAGTLGTGISGGQNAFGLLNNAQNRAFAAQGQSAGGMKEMGGFLADIFKGLGGPKDSVSQAMGSKSTPGIDSLPIFGGGGDTGSGNSF